MGFLGTVLYCLLVSVVCVGGLFSLTIAVLIAIGHVLGNKCPTCGWPVAWLGSGWSIFTGAWTRWFCVRCFREFLRP